MAVVTEAHVKAMTVEIIKSIRLNAPKTLVTVGQALVGGFNSNQRAIAMWTDVDLDFDAPYLARPAHVAVLHLRHVHHGTRSAGAVQHHETDRDRRVRPRAEKHQRQHRSAEPVVRQEHAGAWGWSLFPEETRVTGFRPTSWR